MKCNLMMSLIVSHLSSFFFLASASILLSAVDACDNTPCMNGGFCTNLCSHHSCSCPVCFTGDNCEVGEQSLLSLHLLYLGLFLYIYIYVLGFVASYFNSSDYFFIFLCLSVSERIIFRYCFQTYHKV